MQTEFSKEETFYIGRYFAYLRDKYNIKTSQLQKYCKIVEDSKTINKYTCNKYLTGEYTVTNLPNAISTSTLNDLIDSFTGILKSQKKDVPPELSFDFLASLEELRSFLETLSLDYYQNESIIDAPLDVIDPDAVKKEPESKRYLICDPAYNNDFIATLFGLGSSIVFVIFIFNLFMPQIHLSRLLFFGMLCLTSSLNLALPKMKRPIMVDPQSRAYKYTEILSGIMQSLVYIFTIACEPLMYVSFFGFIICFII